MYKTILVPLDGSHQAETILPHVQDLARDHGAKVILLHVIETICPRGGAEQACIDLWEESEWRAKHTASYLAVLQDRLRDKGIEACTRVVCGPPVKAIIDAAECEGADLIALAGQDHAGWSEELSGCVAAGMLHHVDWPMLLIRSRWEVNVQTGGGTGRTDDATSERPAARGMSRHLDEW
jgi:nucleotide-binding universal stress UspA family protein